MSAERGTQRHIREATPPWPDVLSMNAGIVASRISCLLGGEGERVRDRLRHALGRNLAAEEIARLATAAFAYRAMARHDGRRARRQSPYRQLLQDQLSALTSPLEGNLVLILASTCVRHLVEAAARQSLEGQPGDSRIMTIPAAEDAADLFEVGAREVARALEQHHHHVVLLRAVRTGLFNLQLSATIKAPGAFTQSLLAEFLGDSLRENPAQYDWFEPAGIFTAALSPADREAAR